jgi:hypothetical protein
MNFIQYLDSIYGTVTVTADSQTVDGGDILIDGQSITQSQFSTSFTAWLKSDDVFGGDGFRDYVANQLAGNQDLSTILAMLDAGTYTVELNQNSAGSPYIVELAGLIDFNALFSGAEDSIVKTGKVTQERFYVTDFSTDLNTPPDAHNDRWFVSDNTTATFGQNAALANDTDDDSDPLSIVAINGVVDGGVGDNDANAGVISVTTAAGTIVSYNTSTHQFTLITDAANTSQLGTTGLYAEADAFSYTISDGNGGTDTATVNLTLVDTKVGNSATGQDNINLQDYYDQVYMTESASEGFSFISAKSGNDTVSGIDGQDQLLGNDGSDVLSGGAGNDYIDGAAGANSLYGGMGNDTLVYTVQNVVQDGGADFDTLKFSSGVNLQADNGSVGAIFNIEMVDLTNGGTNTFGTNGGPSGVNRVSTQDVISMTDGADTLYVKGDGGGVDSVYLDAGWTGGAETTVDGVTYKEYTGGGATLYLDVDLFLA